MLPAGLSPVDEAMPARRAGRLLLDFVLPPLCLGCNEIVADARCASVRARAGRASAFVAPPYCARCGVPFAEDLGPRRAVRRLPRAAAALSPGPGRAGLRRRRAGVWSCRSSTATVPTWPAPAAPGWRGPGPICWPMPTSVAPVPLHWRRLFARRYNQAQLLARAVVRHAEDRARLRLAPDLLRRRRWTGSQSGLRARERRGNVAGGVRASIRAGPGRSPGKTVVLVDDVLTTGATVEACGARPATRRGTGMSMCSRWRA